MLRHDDILTDFNEITFFPEMIPLDPPNLCPISNEVVFLSSQLERLSIDVHTHSLRVAIERAKLQKLGTIIRKVKKDLISPKQLSNQIQCDITNLHRRMTDLQREYSHKLAQVNTIAYRSSSRVHQLLITLIPYGAISSNMTFTSRAIVNIIDVWENIVIYTLFNCGGLIFTNTG